MLLLMWLGLGSNFLGNVDFFSRLSSWLGSGHKFCLTPPDPPSVGQGASVSDLGAMPRVLGSCWHRCPSGVRLRPGLRLNLSPVLSHGLCCAALRLRWHLQDPPTLSPTLRKSVTALPRGKAVRQQRKPRELTIPGLLFLFQFPPTVYPLLFSDSWVIASCVLLEFLL